MISRMHRMGWRLGAIALLALLVRAVLPTGYMLAEAQSDSGRYLTLELCDAHAGAPKVVDLDTGKILDAPAKGQRTSQMPPCVCATLTAMAQPEASVQVIAFDLVHSVDFSDIPDVIPGRGIAAPPPPSTGPPAQV